MTTIMDYLISNDDYSSMMIDKLIVIQKGKPNIMKTCIIIKDYEAIIKKYYEKGEPSIFTRVGLFKEGNTCCMATVLRVNNNDKFTYVSFTNPKGNNGLSILEDLNNYETLDVVIYNQKLENKVRTIPNPYKNKLDTFINMSKSIEWTEKDFEELKQNIMSEANNDARILNDKMESMERE